MRRRIDQEHHEQHRQQRDHDADDREQLHRRGRKAGHQIEVQPHQLNSEYFDLPAPRSSCATRISVGFIEKV